MSEKMTVLVVEPGNVPYTKEIDPGLKSLQKEVGGYIEAVYPFPEPVGLVCCESGKLEGMPLNRALRDEDGEIYDIIAGTFLVVGLTEDSFCSLRQELMVQFTCRFQRAELFMQIGEKIISIPMGGSVK